MLVAGLAVLEENIAVFGHAACDGSLRSEGACAEVGKRFAVEEGSEVFLLKHLDFLDFVRGAEPVEEVDERHARFDGREVGYAGEVHDFLHGAFGEHGETCLADGHHVLMVAENREGVRGDGTCRYMEYRREEFTGDFVHVGYHQEQAL